MNTGYRPSPQILRQPMSSLASIERQFPTLCDVAPGSPVPPVDFPAVEECHADFHALLTETLVRFANRTPSEVENELEKAFRRICEFLEIHRAGLWCCAGPETKALTLIHSYPKGPELLKSAQIPDPLSRASEPLVLERGADSNTCFPWITAQVQRGEAIVFSSVAQLPAEALYDKRALLRLHARSGAVLPILIDGKVRGVAGFSCGRLGQAWPHELVERLKLVVQVLGEALVRTIHEAALAKSHAEITHLKNRLQAESDCLKAEVKVTQSHGQIIGRSQAISKVLHQAEQVAPADCAVLINGETGTGKELIAQEIHRLSARRDHVMVLVNCAALPSALVESELFGRERGAYTGALSSQVGRFEVADGSTIFLDEVGELSMEVQAKLLRVLQEGEFQRLGSPKTHKVNVRVIAATNRDLAEAVRKGRFREDLYYRLKVFPIAIPPLRERSEDISSMVFSFMEEFATRMGKKITKVPRKAMEALERHSWPGNIRELRNVIEHSVILTSGDTLKVSLPGDAPTHEPRPVTLAQAEREHILKTLESTRWRIKGPHGAAQRLDMRPSTLYSRMQKLGIPRRRQREEMPAGSELLTS